MKLTTDSSSDISTKWIWEVHDDCLFLLYRSVFLYFFIHSLLVAFLPFKCLWISSVTFKALNSPWAEHGNANSLKCHVGTLGSPRISLGRGKGATFTSMDFRGLLAAEKLITGPQCSLFLSQVAGIFWMDSGHHKNYYHMHFVTTCKWLSRLCLFCAFYTNT